MRNFRPIGEQKQHYDPWWRKGNAEARDAWDSSIIHLGARREPYRAPEPQSNIKFARLINEGATCFMVSSFVCLTSIN